MWTREIIQKAVELYNDDDEYTNLRTSAFTIDLKAEDRKPISEDEQGSIYERILEVYNQNVAHGESPADVALEAIVEVGKGLGYDPPPDVDDIETFAQESIDGGMPEDPIQIMQVGGLYLLSRSERSTGSEVIIALDPDFIEIALRQQEAEMFLDGYSSNEPARSREEWEGAYVVKEALLDKAEVTVPWPEEGSVLEGKEAEFLAGVLKEFSLFAHELTR